MASVLVGDTALSPATLFTVLASGFAVYYFIFKFKNEVNEEQEQKHILSVVETSDIPQLPEELISEILQWLPIKTLQRFKCVSKSLRDIIDSPEFSRWNLTKTTSLNRTHPKIIVQQSPLSFSRDPVKIRAFGMDGGPADLSADQCGFKPSRHTLFAHCNGLVVLEQYSFGLVVWNPTIRKCRKLPALPRKDPIYHNIKPDVMALGFGYDSSIDDYKVIQIKVMCFWVDHHDRRQYEGRILGLRSGYWRKIEVPNDFDGYYATFFLNGALLFLNRRSRVIFVFDLAKEIFSQISLTDFSEQSLSGFGQTQEYPTNLKVFEGCLCVFSLGEEHAKMYARKKNDEGEFCWNKLFSITYQQQLSRLDCDIFKTGVVFGYSKDGDKVFVISGDRHALYSYDFKEKSIKRIVCGRKRNEKVFSCIESLVWIDEEKEKEESNSGTTNKSST